jgi:chromosome segregation ATPase
MTKGDEIMKSLWIMLAGSLLICGCMTPRRVQEMIDENNQKIAAEQLKPEFDRISGQINAVEARLNDLAERLDVLEAVNARSEEKILNLSLALNKAQGDMGVINQEVQAVEALAQSQQSAIRAATDSVKSQNEMLLGVFRRQLSGLAKVIEQLEGDIQGLEPAE